MKRTPLKPRHRPEVEALDRLCRELVMRRDKGRCAWCGASDALQWSHVHTRRVHSLRWRPENSMMLCADCHAHWHSHPFEAATWWERTFPQRMKVLVSSRTDNTKPDLVAIRKYLEKELRAVSNRAFPGVGLAGTHAEPPAVGGR